MTQVPQPPKLPILGNLRNLDLNTPILSIQHLAETYGECYRLDLPGSSTVVLNTQELLNEICDQKRFYKVPTCPLLESRNGVGDALFTAYKDEENWGIAHRILMPRFAPHTVKDMFDEMHEISCQLVLQWAQLGSSHEIDPTDSFTRLTLDTIALCAMDVRFNSFINDALHPFVSAFNYFLAESGRRVIRPKFVSDYIYRGSTRRYWESIDQMKVIAQQAIDERRSHPKTKNDLLNAMLYGEDPKTGKKMTDLSVIQNTIAFLGAGHETTAGMISFLFVLLLKDPQRLRIAQDEVDQVIGDGPVTVDHMSRLPYITACLREVLRLYPSAPGFQVVPTAQEYPVYIGKQRYQINQGDNLGANLPKIHRDPLVYGEDSEDFRPERMLHENFDRLPSNSWKPFGNGIRACIGKAFAWQEGHLITALLLQNFNFRAADSSYNVEISQSLTIKPKGFIMHAELREGIDLVSLERRMRGDMIADTQ